MNSVLLQAVKEAYVAPYVPPQGTLEGYECTDCNETVAIFVHRSEEDMNTLYCVNCAGDGRKARFDPHMHRLLWQHPSGVYREACSRQARFYLSAPNMRAILGAALDDEYHYKNSEHVSELRIMDGFACQTYIEIHVAHLASLPLPERPAYFKSVFEGVLLNIANGEIPLLSLGVLPYQYFHVSLFFPDASGFVLFIDTQDVFHRIKTLPIFPPEVPDTTVYAEECDEKKCSPWYVDARGLKMKALFHKGHCRITQYMREHRIDPPTDQRPIHSSSTQSQL